MEITLINKKDMPVKRGYIHTLRRIIKVMEQTKKKDVIQLVLNKEDNYKSVKSAWTKICDNELKKHPKTKVITHELGKTVWLWWE